MTTAERALPAAVLDMLTEERDRPRSKSGFGPSGLLDCSRAAYHQLNGDEPCNPDQDPWKAMVGTAIHEAYTTARVKHSIGGEAKVRLHLAGVSGEADFLDVFEGVVEDLKTKADAAAIDGVRRYGPDRGDLAQINWYAKAAGVSRWRLVYVPRNGKMTDSYAVEGDLDEDLLATALGWLADRRVEVAAQQPPSPEKDPATWCAQFCAFYGDLCGGRVVDKTDLPLLDERAAEALRDYDTERRTASEAEKRKKAAQSVLVGIAGRTEDGFAVTHSTPKDTSEVDLDAIKRDYEAAGRPLPTRPSTTSSRINVTAPKETK